MTQLGIPVDVRAEDVARQKTLGQAIVLCSTMGGLEPKELAYELNSDKGQVSRWQNDQEGITWKKLSAVMDACGNDAPLLWMLDQRGYDLASLRRKETETERMWREAESRAAELERDLDTLRRYVGSLK